MILSLDEVFESRLCWPDSKPRAAQRNASAFKSTEVAKEQRRIEGELSRWGIRHYIISRNNQRLFAGDPAAAGRVRLDQLARVVRGVAWFARGDHHGSGRAQHRRQLRLRQLIDCQ